MPGKSIIKAPVSSGISPLAQFEMIRKTATQLSNAVQSTFNWLDTREKRKALESALKVKVKQLKYELHKTKEILKTDIAYWKIQAKDNSNSRSLISQQATELIKIANRCINTATQIAENGNPELASKFIEASVNAINQSTDIIRAKFPSSSLK